MSTSARITAAISTWVAFHVRPTAARVFEDPNSSVLDRDAASLWVVGTTITSVALNLNVCKMLRHKSIGAYYFHGALACVTFVPIKYIF